MFDECDLLNVYREPSNPDESFLHSPIMLTDVHCANKVPMRCMQSDKRSIGTAHIDAVIRVYDEAGNVIETHQHKGGFKEW